MNNLGARVKAVREERGITTTQLSRAVGISQPQISRLEHGQQGFRSLTLEKIAKVLGVSPAFLFADPKVDDVAAVMLKHEPELKKVIGSVTLSDLALRLVKLQKGNAKAFRAVKVVIEQFTK